MDTETVLFSIWQRTTLANPVAAGFVRYSGPRVVWGGGLAFAAFSAAIDLFLRREPANRIRENQERIHQDLLEVQYTLSNSTPCYDKATSSSVQS